MSVHVEFHFDFGSPNAYLSHLVIPAIESRTGVRFAYVPVLLGGVFKATGNVSPAVSQRGIKNKGEYAERETQRFLKRHGITQYVFNPYFPVNTLLIMRGAVAAEIDGRLAAYSEAVFGNMWEEGLKMDDPAVAMTALTESGLDGAKLLARAQDADVKAKLIENTQKAVERGAT